MIKTYHKPLLKDELRDLWEEWKKRNPQAVSWLYNEAKASYWYGKRVSSKYLIEKLRYESGIDINPVIYFDQKGNEHKYAISNDLTHFIAVWLKDLMPSLDIVIKYSRFDENKI